MPRRIDQLAHELRDLTGKYLQDHVEFPAGIFVTVTRAHVPEGKGSATVYLSVLPPELGSVALAAVTPHLYDLQGHVNHSLRSRHPPRVKVALEPGPPASPPRPEAA